MAIPQRASALSAIEHQAAYDPDPNRDAAPRRWVLAVNDNKMGRRPMNSHYIDPNTSPPPDEYDDRDDRAWFMAHPKRRWRLRDPCPGEMGDFAKAADLLAATGVRFAIAVFQPTPGLHDRHRVGLRTRDPFDTYTDAGILALVPELAVINAGGRP